MSNAERTFRKILRVESPSESLRGGQIPLFSPHAVGRDADKYDQDSKVVDFYTTVAYGFKPGLWGDTGTEMGKGAAEGLYRTISSMLLTSTSLSASSIILDLGCGVGRTIYECASVKPSYTFIGMDFSYRMCERAFDILKAKASISLDGVRDRGYPGLVFDDTKQLENVVIAQGDAMSLPFSQGTIDCVVATFLADRVSDPTALLSEVARVLKPGGILILSTPLNFLSLDLWSQLRDEQEFASLVERCGFLVEEKFDGLICRMTKDARSNYQDWLVLVVKATKVRESLTIRTPIEFR